MIQLFLTPLTVPAGTQLPSSQQANINAAAQFLEVSGAENFDGLNYGSSTPTADNRDKPWFKTDTFGNPIGFYSWNGVGWQPIPSVVANGTSGSRPLNPTVGTEYYDTTIKNLLIWNGTIWTTASGSVGDLKEVLAGTIDVALANNPGWAQHTDSTGCVIGAAGAATVITATHPYGQIIGEEAHTIQISELPSHTHTVPTGGGTAHADGNAAGGILADTNTATSSAIGGGQAANVIQPTAYYWRLVKTS